MIIAGIFTVRDANGIEIFQGIGDGSVAGFAGVGSRAGEAGGTVRMAFSTGRGLQIRIVAGRTDVCAHVFGGRDLRYVVAADAAVADAVLSTELTIRHARQTRVSAGIIRRHAMLVTMIDIVTIRVEILSIQIALNALRRICAQSASIQT